MPRIRTIKPEFWSSPSTAKASPVARLAFIAMWNWADDHGRGTANLKELEGFIFPHDDIAELSSGNTVHFRDVVAEVAECFDVVFYKAEERPYYAILKWDDHQRNERRAAASKYPEPTGIPAFSGSVAEIPSQGTVDPNISGPGTGEQGNRGTGEQSLSSDKSDGAEMKDFETFWDLYAKKVGRKQTVARWNSALKKPGVTSELLIKAASEYVGYQTAEGKHPQYSKDPAAWLNGEHWNDERSSRAAAPIRTALAHLRPVEDIEEPPPFLSPDEYEQWRRAKPGRR
jgi:hypothetical protein